MFYFELKDEALLRLGYGTEETIVNIGKEKYGNSLIGVYQDDGNVQFTVLWKPEELSATKMKVRHYKNLSNGFHALAFDVYVASRFESPLQKDQNNTLSVWFCVPGSKDSNHSRKQATKILSTRAVNGHRSFRSIEVTPSILNVKGAIEMLTRATVIDTILKDLSLIPDEYECMIF